MFSNTSVCAGIFDSEQKRCGNDKPAKFAEMIVTGSLTLRHVLTI
jgi:hypothetical protein